MAKKTKNRARPLADRIMIIVRRYGAGNRVFTPADFARPDLDDAAVRKALSRLVADGKLSRIKQGLYFWPRVSKVLKKPVPANPDAIVDAIARRDHVTIISSNLVAANDLGVTNAVPAKAVYLTTGNPMTITVGGYTIKIQRAPKSVLAAIKTQAAKIVQALTWLGKKSAMHSDNITKLRDSMSDAAKAALSSIKGDLPKWMRDVACALLSGGNAPQHA